MSIASSASLDFCLSSSICCIVNGSELFVEGLMMRSSMVSSTVYIDVSIRESPISHYAYLSQTTTDAKIHQSVPFTSKCMGQVHNIFSHL